MATEYQVWRIGQDDPNPAADLLGSATATGPRQALKAVAGESEGKFMIVPTRNMHVVERVLEQRPIDRITEVPLGGFGASRPPAPEPE